MKPSHKWQKESPIQELAAQIHPDVPWRGGEEYEREPFRALVDNSGAKQVLGWQPRYSWHSQQ